MSKERNRVPVDFYNEKIDIGHERDLGEMINHRIFNNWIKSVVIKKAIKEIRIKSGDSNIFVLDIGCGKGGDLLKYQYENIKEYIGVDISIGQLRDAVIRRISSKISFPTTFILQSCDIEHWEFAKKIPKSILNPISTITPPIGGPTGTPPLPRFGRKPRAG